MDLMTSFVIFAAFIVLYRIIIEIFTILFRITGVTAEKAKMQVISLLTNSGYTTAESEIIMASRRRRKIARAAMICGYSLSVIIISSLVNILVSLKQAEISHVFESVLIVSVIMILYVCIGKIKFFKSKFDLLIERIGNQVMFGKRSNILLLIDIYKENALVEAILDNVPHILQNKKISETRLKEDCEI